MPTPYPGAVHKDVDGPDLFDLDTFMEFLNRSTGRSFVSESMSLPPKRITLTGMPVKDLRRCVAAADDVGTAMPMVTKLLEAGADDNEGPGS